MLDKWCGRFSEGYLNDFSTKLSSQIFDWCPRNFLIQEKQNGNVVSTSHWIRPVPYRTLHAQCRDIEWNSSCKESVFQNRGSDWELCALSRKYVLKKWFPIRCSKPIRVFINLNDQNFVFGLHNFLLSLILSNLNSTLYSIFYNLQL